MPQGSVHWQGTQRRACGPGANWNVQVVRGKVTTRCIWHACKALGIGLLLMLLGACMATIGYYADQLSVAQEIRGNITVKVKNESRGFHLNNLSYAGPIVMGVGGFIVVAACVMTFEARDSAAKVVPARFRFSQGSTLKNRNQRSRRSTSSQTTKWDHQFGLFRVNRTPSPSAQEICRKQLTAEFMRFSKNLHEKGVPTNPIKKSPSAPSLVTKKSSSRKISKYAGCALLNPELLQRQALSVDNPGYSPQHKNNADSIEHDNKGNGSQVSMAMDLHIPNKGPVTLKVKDRSDTARRHQLLRQTKIDDAEEAAAAEELRRSVAQAKKQPQPDIAGYSLSAYSRFPDDFLPRKRSSIDVRTSDELGLPTPSSCSPRDFRKISSPNFRNMSFDRIGGERRIDRSLGNRKASLEFKRSPDFRRADYRCILDDGDVRSRANTGESFRRHRQQSKLQHSRSDDTRRRSFDKHRRDSQKSSRHSLNTQAVLEACGPEYELKYFTTPTIDTSDQVSRANSDETHHVVEINEDSPTNVITPEQSPAESDALLEEPELEDTSTSDEEDEKVVEEAGDSKIQAQSSKGSCKRRLVTQETVLHVEAD